jgi:Flp pilus assembly protein TadD
MQSVPEPATRLRRDLGQRGYTYLQLGDLPAAIADFTHALKLDPKMTSSLYGRGVAKERSGDKAGAELDYAAARRQDSDIKAEMVAQNVLP